MRAGVEHERPKLRRRLSKVIQGAVDLRKIAFVTTTHRDLVRIEAQPFQAGSKGRPGLLAILLSHMRERGKKNGAVFNQRLEDVILHDHFLSGTKLGFETTTRHFLKRVFEQINFLVGLDGASSVPVQQYSDGMKQRLALARALLTESPVLLLDEPTRSLDPAAQGEIRKFLRRTVVERLNKTVLLVTHSLAEAEQVCDRLAILDRGRIVSIGTSVELRASFGGPDLAAAFERAVGADRCH